MKLSYYVINLVQRTDRLASFRASLAGIGGSPQVEVTHVPGIWHNDFGALGCTKSHVSTLSKFLTETDSSHCVIFEDDFEFLRPMSTVNELLSFALEARLRIDVLLLGGTYVKALKTQWSGLAKVFESQSTLGYVVARHYVPTLINVFAESIPVMEKFRYSNNRLPLVRDLAADQVWKRLQRVDDWFISIPAIGRQTASYSDIEKKQVDYSGVSW